MNLCDEAETLLLYQFSRSAKLKALLRSLTRPFEEVLGELEKLHRGRYIDEAKGETLGVLGKIVGQPRRDMSDEDYRAWIKVGILLNNSSGTPESVLTILAILFGKRPNIRMEEYLQNDVVFTFFTLPKASLKALFNIIENATPVSTFCHFIRADLELAFRFDASTLAESSFAEFFEETYEYRN